MFGLGFCWKKRHDATVWKARYRRMGIHQHLCSAAHPHVPSCSTASSPTMRTTITPVSLHLHHFDTCKVSPSLPKLPPRLNSSPKLVRIGQDCTYKGPPWDQVLGFSSHLCVGGKGFTWNWALMLGGFFFLWRWSRDLVMRSCSVRLVRCLRDFTSSMCCGQRKSPFTLDKYKKN